MGEISPATTAEFFQNADQSKIWGGKTFSLPVKSGWKCLVWSSFKAPIICRVPSFPSVTMFLAPQHASHTPTHTHYHLHSQLPWWPTSGTLTALHRHSWTTLVVPVWCPQSRDIQATDSFLPHTLQQTEHQLKTPQLRPWLLPWRRVVAPVTLWWRCIWWRTKETLRTCVWARLKTFNDPRWCVLTTTKCLMKWSAVYILITSQMKLWTLREIELVFIRKMLESFVSIMN